MSRVDIKFNIYSLPEKANSPQGGASMRKYEVMYIIKADLQDETRQELINSMHAIITNNGGAIDNVDEWGVKELAYEIDDMKKGYYVVTKFTAANEALNEFDRLMHINSNIVRFMIVNIEE